MKETTLRKTNSRVKTNAASTTGQDVDAGSMVMIGSMGVVSALIGGGAVICFVSAMVNTGPLSLAQGFLTAVGVI